MEHSYKDMSVLVTGGCGFIGAHLVRTLVRLGAYVTVLDNGLTSSIDVLQDVKETIIYINKSITDPHACLEATHGKQIVFHLAAVASVPASLDNPSLCHQVNVEGTFNLLEASRLHGVERFVFSSSAAVYGDHEGVCHEQQQCMPQSPYGYSKLLGELYCQQYARIYGLHAVSLRYFNLYDDWQRAHGRYASIITSLRQTLENNEPIIVYGDGTYVYDFVTIEQIVEANLTLGMLKRSHMNGDVYNIASGKSMTLLELVAHVRQEFPDSTSTVIFQHARTDDIKQSIADCSKYASILDYVYT